MINKICLGCGGEKIINFYAYWKRINKNNYDLSYSRNKIKKLNGRLTILKLHQFPKTEY